MTIDNIVMWIIQLNTVDKVCFKAQILLVTLRTRDRLQVIFLHFRKSHVRAHKFDVEEANISVSKFYRIRDYSTGCWFANGRYYCS